MRLRAGVGYDPNRVSEADGRRIASYFGLILKAMGEAHDTRHDSASLLRSEERQQIIAWNRTSREYESRRSLPELFEEQVRHNPHALAVVCGNNL